MSDTDLKWLTALVGAGLVVVVALGAIVGSRAVARDLQGSAETALVAAGLDGVLVDLAGREATLQGGSRADLREARDVVERVPGVRWAEVTSDDDERDERDGDPSSAEASTILLVRGDDGVTISGIVPDVDAAADIKAAASLVLDATVSGDLVVDPSVSSSPWVDALPDLLGALVDVDDLRLGIDGGGTLELRGEVANEVERSTVVQVMAVALPELDVVDRLTVVAADDGSTP